MFRIQNQQINKQQQEQHVQEMDPTSLKTKHVFLNGSKTQNNNNNKCSGNGSSKLKLPTVQDVDSKSQYKQRCLGYSPTTQKSKARSSRLNSTDGSPARGAWGGGGPN